MTDVHWRRRRQGVLLAALMLAAGPAPTASAQAPAAPADAPTLSVRTLSRIESWQFFEPQPGGGDPDYVLFANRVQLELRRRWSRAELTLTAQHVGLAGLPDDASGPGALGTGPLYFDQGGRRTNPQQLYLRYANVRVKDIVAGLDVQVGRFAYASGGEAAAKDPKVELVRRQRLESRLLGEFEWSLYQRAFDGVRADWTRRGWRATALAVKPTQGGFARASGLTIDDVLVTGGALTAPPALWRDRGQLQIFGFRYKDDRRAPARPDNTGLGAARIDVVITTLGASHVGAYPLASGEIDVLLWGVGQWGDWYGQTHRASAAAVEGGHQWTAAAWKPWLRAGALVTSGDNDPRDARHGTFFPMLPTVRKFSQTTVYSTMNLTDVYGQIAIRPAAPLGLRFDLHRLWLSSAADLWYGGSGATAEREAGFGYAGRRSNGSRDLGLSMEASADVRLAPAWSIGAFAGHIRGGRVVSGTFGNDRLWFAYVESVVRLDDLLRLPR